MSQVDDIHDYWSGWLEHTYALGHQALMDEEERRLLDDAEDRSLLPYFDFFVDSLI